MRYVSRIQDLWDAGGPFVFGDRPCGRVTVEKSYELRLADAAGGRNQKSPYRWFQRGVTTEQYETEIPNIKNIDIERDLNSDAATCKVTVMNTKSLLLGEAEEQEGVWGKPGYFTYSRGLSQEAKARWGQSANEWSNVLTPNALLRTYQGYGGHDKTIAEAVEDGDLVLTGVWLVDEVNVGANTDLSISCRDMAKLLIEQQLYPPLMPSRLYPLEYYRWKNETTAIPSGELPAGSDNPVGLTCHYGCDFGGSVSSSTDSVYGYNANILGHYPTDAFDSSPNPDSLEHQTTFWLSNGHSSPSGFEWIEMCCDGQETNKVYIHPWGGSYECYVSVWENGAWVAPEDSEEGGIVPCLDYSGANTAEIPYVTKVGVPWEAWDRQAEHSLPRVYRADKIRLTFTNLTASQWEAPNHYRAGVRKIFPMFDRKEAIARGWLSTYACASFPKVDTDAVGYWQARQNGAVFGFGDARTYPSAASNPTNVHTSWVVAMYGNHDGLGYWTMGMNGQVIAYGSAVHYGDRSTDSEIPGGYTGFAPTPTGLGYWLLRRDGWVFPFGDAADHGSPSYTGSLPTGVDAWAHCIESHPVDSGYWVLWTDGHVDAQGSVTDFGDANRTGFTDTEYVGTLRRTSAGDGYWIVSGGGKIQQFGSAFNYGSATVWPPEDWAQGLVWDFVPNWNTDGGYAFQRANGELDYRGDWEWFGSVADGQAIQRKDGNYKDYCLDEDTEILTGRGWLRYDQLRDGDEAWSLNPETGEAEWTKVDHVYSYHHSGKALRLEGRFIDAIASPNHRWITSVRWDDRYRFVRSEELKTTHDIPLCPDLVKAPEVATVSDDIVELVAWYWTEGSLDGNRVSISQSKVANPIHVDRIDSVLRNLFGDPGALRAGRLWRRDERPNGVVVFRLSSSLVDVFGVPAPNKVPTVEWLSSLTLEQRRRFVHISLLADGHIRNNASVLTQVEEKRIRSFEIACILAGKGVATNNYDGTWSTTIVNRKTCKPITKRRITEGSSRWEEYNGTMWCPVTGNGTWMARRNGRCYFTGNCDIVKDLVLWSGFHLYDPDETSADPVVYGNIESTGAYAKEDLPKDMFDKKPVIDPITQLKEVVGYIVWVDQEGGFRFESPNWWALGNYDYSGVELDLIPVVDEMTQMLSYNVSASDRDARSEIMISTAEPTEDFSDTLTTRIVPQSAAILKGMVRPAQWFNGMFLNKKEQEVMAELISMHIWFAERMGSVTCWANPLIDINDQVRIYERTTGETFVHYVRGVSSTFDAETNSYQMTLTTNWLGGSPFNRRPLFLSCASKPDGTGYWQARNDGSIYAFGDAELFGTDDTHLNWVVSIRSSSTGEGYYTLDLNGGVIARGDAVHYGELNREEEDCVDMAVTPTGAGYWILTKDGEVFPFGDANDHGGVTPTGTLPSGEAVVAHSIESHPTDDGYWILTTDGTVAAAGALSSFGDADRSGFRYTEYVAELRRTVTGDGYWIVSGSGRVQEFGDAVHSGQPPAYPQAEWVDGLVWSFLPNYTGSGYAIQHADGNLDFFGVMSDEGEAYTSGAHQQMDWGIGTQGTVDVSVEPSAHYVIADPVVEFMEGLASPSARKALSTGFGHEDDPPLKAAP